MKHEVGQVLVSSSSSAVLLDTYFVYAKNIRIIRYGISPRAELQFYNQNVVSIFCNVVTKPDFCREIKMDVMCDISSFQTRRSCLPHPFFHLCLDDFYGRNISFFIVFPFLWHWQFYSSSGLQRRQYRNGPNLMLCCIDYSNSSVITSPKWWCRLRVGPPLSFCCLVIPGARPLTSGPCH